MAATTLYEDWRARRDALSAPGGPSLPHAPILIQLLDYLLARHKEDPEAAQPAEAPPAAEFSINDRARVVLQHQRRTCQAGARTREEARDRAVRLARALEGHSTKPMGRSDPFWMGRNRDPLPGQKDFQRTPTSMLLDYHSIFPAPLLFEKGSPLSDPTIEILYSKLIDPKERDGQAAHLMTHCGNPTGAIRAVAAWRSRLLARGRDPIVALLEKFFRKSPFREQIAAELRFDLAADNARLRITAARLLSQIGTVKEIPLLLDLLALPPRPGEHPGERRALAAAIRRIAGRSRRVPKREVS